MTKADLYSIMKAQRKGNKMIKKITKQNVKLELFKIDRRIEKTLIRYNNELGQHNKSCLMADLQGLWDCKKALQECAL